MARVKYTGVVSDLSGSVSGTTFQKNSSGSIARAKTTQSFFPSQLQSASRNDFAKVSTYWSKLDLSVQQNWNAYAAAHPIYDRWGNVKTLNGFQYYMQSNINLLGLGLEIIPTPPVFSPQEIVPDYEIVAYSNSLHLDFYPAINYPDCDLVVYASAPTTSSSLLNRKNIWWIGNFPAPSGGIFDIKSFYEQCFNVTWSSFFNSATCNIIFQVILVNRVTGIASPFKGFILSLRNAPEPNWYSLGSSFSDLGRLASSSGCIASCQFYNGIALAYSYSPNGLYRSTNNGSSWLPISLSNTIGNRAWLVCNSDGVAYLAGSTDPNIYVSLDFGLTWSIAYTNSFGAVGYSSIQLLPSGDLWASVFNVGYVIHFDSLLNSWFSLFSGYSVSSTAVCYLEAGVVVLSLNQSSSIVISLDNGATWGVPFALPDNSILTHIVYCGNGILIAAGANTSGIWRSLDFGLTWSLILLPVSITSNHRLLYVGNGVVFLGTGGTGKFFKSMDYGLSWSVIALPAVVSNVRAISKGLNNSMLLGCFSPDSIFRYPS